MSANYDSTLINAQLAATSPQKASARFSTVLVAAVVAGSFTGIVKSYTSEQAVIDDKVALGDALAAELQLAFAHPTRKPNKVLVGKVVPDVAQVSTVTVTGTDDGDYTIDVNGNLYTHTAAGQTDAQIATALALLVNADLGVGAAASTNTVVVTSSTAGTPFTIAVTNASGNLAVLATTASNSIEDQMNLILADNSDWQVVVPFSHTETDILRLAKWATINKRLQYAQMGIADVLDKVVSNLVDDIVGAGYEEYTALAYSSTGTEPCALGHAANRTSFDADTQSVGWAWVRNLPGVSVEKITDTQLQNLRDQYVNVYLMAKGQKAMGPARTLAGRQIKHRMTIDWLNDTIERRVAALVLDRADAGLGLSYDADGFEVISEIIRGVLADAEDAGHIRAGNHVDGRPYSRVFTPKLSAIGDTDKANYRANWVYTIVFKSELEGADAQGYGSTDEEYIDSIQLALA